MYAYLKGKVTELGPSYIVLEVNGIGYLINVANPFSFNVNEDYTVYVYVPASAYATETKYRVSF